MGVFCRCNAQRFLQGADGPNRFLCVAVITSLLYLLFLFYFFLKRHFKQTTIKTNLGMSLSGISFSFFFRAQFLGACFRLERRNRALHYGPCPIVTSRVTSREQDFPAKSGENLFRYI